MSEREFKHMKLPMLPCLYILERVFFHLKVGYNIHLDTRSKGKLPNLETQDGSLGTLCLIAHKINLSTNYQIAYKMPQGTSI